MGKFIELTVIPTMGQAGKGRVAFNTSMISRFYRGEDCTIIISGMSAYKVKETYEQIIAILS